MERLMKDQDGRFECQGFPLHSGDLVELMLTDHWRLYRIESSAGDYYAMDVETEKGFWLCEGIEAKNPRHRGLVAG